MKGNAVLGGHRADHLFCYVEKILENQGFIVGNPGHVEDRFRFSRNHSENNPLDMGTLHGGRYYRDTESRGHQTYYRVELRCFQDDAGTETFLLTEGNDVIEETRPPLYPYRKFVSPVA